MIFSKEFEIRSTTFNKIIFDFGGFWKNYLVNFGPNFVGLFLLSGDDLGKTIYVGFISA